VVGSRQQDGAAAVEFALLLPLLILLLFGFIQFGLAFNSRIQATNAAREAARLAVVGIDDFGNIGGTSFWNIVRDRAGAGPISNRSFVTENVVGGNFDFPIDLVIPFLPSPPSLQAGTARASMRIEQLSNPLGPGGC
jgi:Flp pilus assembly pilin Flp